MKPDTDFRGVLLRDKVGYYAMEFGNDEVWVCMIMVKEENQKRCAGQEPQTQ